MTISMPTLKHLQKSLFNIPLFKKNRPFSAYEKTLRFPQLNIKNHNDSYFIECNLRHADPNKLNVYFKHGTLIISGEMEKKAKAKEADEFYRSVFLKDVSDNANIEAIYRHGILKLIAPKEPREGLI